MSDKRLIGENGPRDFTCANATYSTNTEKGESHGSFSHEKGSVLKKPLVEREELTLWLEHVKSKNDALDWFWLMWYKNGIPTIPLSGVFNRDDLMSLMDDLVPR